MTKRFIRLDMVGHWRGVEHCSTFAMDPDYWGDETNWEEGISCYCLDDIPYALENLRHYWEDIASMHGNYEQPVKMQITVFAGKTVGTGSDLEDLAICEETLMEFPAQAFMRDIIAAEEEGDNEKEYKEELIKIAKKYNIA